MWVADWVDDKIYAYYGYSPLAASDVTVSSATLTLGGHTGDWWIKQTAPHVRPCTAGETDYSHAVSRLTMGREYTYKAYSASSCSGGTELASVTFTTKAPGDRKAALDSILFHLYWQPRGIWSDGTTMWVADADANKLYSYKLSDGSYAGFNEIALAADNASAGSIWSDGTTMWVTDTDDSHIYAYNVITDKTRDGGKEFTSAALSATGNDNPDGIWSDGTTMWVYDRVDEKLYSYTLSDRSYDGSKDIGVPAVSDGWGYGMWSDGGTVWIVDASADKLIAYSLSSGSREEDKDVILAYPLDYTDPFPVSVWSDGTTMWVADRTYSNLLAYYGFPALAAGDVAVTSATVTLSGHEADWWIRQTAPTEGACAVGESDYSHALSSLKKDTEYTYTAYSASGCSGPDEIASATFTTNGSGYPNSSEDFDTLSGASNEDPRGMWSDGTTMWVADRGGNKIYAYKVSDMSRDASKDFSNLSTAGNENPSGIWSDGTTMWVADTADKKLYAYSMTSKNYDSSKDIALHTNNALPGGLWSDGTTMWVADTHDDSIFAYTMSTKARDTSKGFGVRGKGVDKPWGIWSDGTIMWVADREDDKVYAFDIANKSHYPPKDFDTLGAAGNNHPSGMWSDGETMWVADTADGKIYGYSAYPTLRASNVAAASATLTLAGHTGSWWIKQASPTAGDCTAGEADYSHALSNLTASTDYAFEAFSKAGCDSADLIAAATFTTPAS